MRNWGCGLLTQAGVFAFALMLASCATITKGTNQTVAVDTPGVPGAQCVIQAPNGPMNVVTPGSVVLGKGSQAFTFPRVPKLSYCVLFGFVR